MTKKTASGEAYFTSPEFRKKRLIRWIVRTLFAVILFYFFWDRDITKTLLIIYIPLSLISLAAALGMNFWFTRWLQKFQIGVANKVDDILDEEEDDNEKPSQD